MNSGLSTFTIRLFRPLLLIMFGLFSLTIFLPAESYALSWTTHKNIYDTNNQVYLNAVTYGNGSYIAVGSNGLIVRSTDGVNWTTIRSNVSGETLQSVGYGNGKFVAVGRYTDANNNDTAKMVSSSDGITWTYVTLPVSTQYLGSVKNVGGLWFSGGNNGLLLKSNDAVTWESVTTGVSGFIQNFAVLNNNSTLGSNKYYFSVNDNAYSVTANDIGKVYSSTTGSSNSWTLEGSRVAGVGNNMNFFDILGPKNGEVYFLFDSGSNEYKSTNYGSSWSAMGLTQQAFGGTYGQGRFVLYASANEVLTSVDGNSWTASTTNYGEAMKSITYGNATKTFVAISNNGKLMYSGDGASWTTSNPNVKGIESNNGLYVIAANNADSSGGTIYTSQNLDRWTQRLQPVSGNFNALAYGNGAYVAVGSGGIIYRSTDGITWSLATGTGTTTFQFVKYLNNQFIAVGNTGVVYTSANGSAWTAKRSSNASLGTVFGVIYDGTNYVFAGSVSGSDANSFNIHTSTDLNTFNGVRLTESGNALSFRSIAFANGTYIAVGASGKIYTSADASVWTSQTPDYTALGFSTSPTLNRISYANGNFIAVGSLGSVIRSADGVTWSRESLSVYGTFQAIHENADIQLIAGNNFQFFSTKLAANIAPRATNVSISGKLQIGREVTGTYTFTDEDADAEGSSQFKWYRSDDATGTNKVAINGAIAKTYRITSDDLHKYLSFEVTPVAASGSTNGATIESAYSAKVLSQIVNFSGAGIYVRPGGTSYTWSFDQADSPAYPNDAFSMTQVDYDNPFNVTVRGKFQYSTNKGSSWNDYVVTSTISYINTPGTVWRFIDQMPSDSTTTSMIPHRWGIDAPNSTIISGWATVHPDLAPTNITLGVTSFFSDAQVGDTLTAITAADTGLSTGGSWTIVSQSVNDLFRVSYDPESGNGATLKLGAGTVPADGQTATITLRYNDIYQNDVNGQPLNGQGFSKTFTITFYSPVSNEPNLGNQLTVNTTVNGDKTSPASVRLSNGNYVTVWQSCGQDGEAAAVCGIYGQQFDSNANPTGSEFAVTTAGNGINEVSPVVSALSNGRFAVAYQKSNGNDFDVAYRIVNSSGVPGAESIANTTTLGDQSFPAIMTRSNGNFVIAWTSPATTDSEIRLQEVDGTNGSLIGSELNVAPTSGQQYYSPSLAESSNGTYVVAFYDYAATKIQFVFSNNLSTPIVVDVDSYNMSLNSYYPYVRVIGKTGGGFVVAWSSMKNDPNNSTVSDIFYKFYDQSGSGISSIIQLTPGSGYHTDPVMSEQPDGNIVFVWQNDQDYEGYGVFAQRISSTGALVDTAPFEINQLRRGNQVLPVVTALDGIKFISTWADAPLNSSFGQIKARLYALANAAPTAAGVSISGTAAKGVALTGAYTYADAESDAEGVSTFKWYRADDNTGANVSVIAGATGSSYTLQNADVGKYIRFEVTPVASAGTTTGTAVQSAYTGPVIDAPYVSSVAVPADKNPYYEENEVLTFTVTPDRAVTVTGVPRLPVTLDTGGTVYAEYDAAASTTTSLVFRYTVYKTDVDTNGITVGSALDLNGNTATIQDATTNVNMQLSLTGVVPSTSGIDVDGRAGLTITNVYAANTEQTYDGTINVVLDFNYYGVNGKRNPGDDVDLDISQSQLTAMTGEMADKHVGLQKPVTIPNMQLTGTQANEYKIIGHDPIAIDIVAADLQVTGVTADNKTYDQTDAATLSGTAAIAPIQGDVVNLSTNYTASFADKVVANGKIVTVTGYAISGADSSNYNLLQPIGLTANITKKDLQVTGVTADNKTYDQTDAATLSGTAAIAPIQGDVVNLSTNYSASFADKVVANGKAVTVSGYAISGADAGNYNLLQPANLTANITKKDLQVTGVTADNKTYDQTDAATLSGTAAIAPIQGDVVNLSTNYSASFADKVVSNGKAVTVTGYAISGADAGNYNLLQPANLTANITKKDLQVTGVTADNKTYDQTDAATLSGTAAIAPIQGDVVNLSTNYTASFADKVVANGKAVTVTGYAISGGDAGNYNLLQPANLTANITKKDLQVTGVTADNKTYDQTDAATLSGTAAIAPIQGDVVNLSTNYSASFADKVVANGKAVTVSGYAISGADAGNYNLLQPANLTANITKKDLQVTGVTADNKTYDQTDAATLSGTAAIAPIQGDVVNLSTNYSASFADKVVANGKAVTVTGYAISGGDAGNYNLLQPANLTANITKKDLQVTGVTADNKTYDQTDAATLSGTAAIAPIQGDVVNLSTNYSASFADKVVSNGKAVTVTGYAISGGDAGNYNLLQPSGLTANITKKDLQVTGVTADNKTYDQTDAATLSGTAAIAPIQGDVVNLSTNYTASFADKVVANGKIVTVTGYAISGGDAGNYNLLQPANLTANITKKDLQVTGVTADNKTYDQTDAATLSGTAAIAPIQGDVVNLSTNYTASFADKVVANGKAVTVTGYAISGGDAGNYNLLQPSNLTANITKKDLQVTGVTADNKTYDQTDAATLSGTAAIAPIQGDVVNLSTNYTASFADKVVSNGKAVTVSGYAISGGDAGNYNLLQPSGLTANITKKDLQVTGVTADNKTYDQTDAATLSGTAAIAPIQGDVVNLTTNYTASFADKVVSNGKAVTVTGYAISGGDAGNYNLLQPANLTANITKKDLQVTGVTADNKTYDQTDAATLSGTAAIAPIQGDVVNLSTNYSASFADKVVANGKAVTVTGYAISGGDAGNYNLLQPSGLTANITKKDLQVTGVTADNKTYDQTDAATLSGTAAIAPIQGDVVNLSTNYTASFADKVVANGKAVTVTGYAISGGDAGNYNLLQPSGLTANITKKTVSVTAGSITSPARVYDQTTTAPLDLTNNALTGVIGGDTVTLVTTAVQAVYNDKTAGQNKPVTVSGLTLGGSDGGNYDLQLPYLTTGEVKAKAIDATGIVVNNRLYDATVQATTDVSGAGLSGVINGDQVTLNTGAIQAAFADKKAGSSKAATVSGLSLNGNDAGNYSLKPYTTTASVRVRPVSFAGVTLTDKVYDGTVAARINASNAAVFGIVAGDSAFAVTESAVGMYQSAAAGTNKPVLVTGIFLTGADAANYLVNDEQMTASILVKTIDVSGIRANDKGYDGTATATLNTANVAMSGKVDGDDVQVSTAGATAAFASRDAGTNKTVTYSGVRLTGAAAANYTLNLPVITASIEPKTVSVSGITAADKTYDGSTQAVLNTDSAGLSGVISGDQVSLNGANATGSFGDAAAGSNKTVQISGLNLNGAQAGNYRLSSVSTTATIRTKNVQVSGITAEDKKSDGTTKATLNTKTAGLTGVIAGDEVKLETGAAAGTFETAKAGKDVKVTVNGLKLSGAASGNYVLENYSTTATIESGVKSRSALLAGMGMSNFGSEDGLTRGMFAVILSKYLSENPYKLTYTLPSKKYTDVPEDVWYAYAIDELSRYGVLAGFTDGSFKPNQPILARDLKGAIQKLQTVLAKQNPAVSGKEMYCSDCATNYHMTELNKYLNSYVVYNRTALAATTAVKRGEAIVVLNRLFHRGPIVGTATSPYKDITTTHWAYEDIMAVSVGYNYERTTDDAEKIVK